MTPEAVRSMLFSAKPSDVKLLYKNLPASGRSAARAAVIDEALTKAGGMEATSPEKFKTQLVKMGSQIGVFFSGQDLDAVVGLQRALQLTSRAGAANVMPMTGQSLLPMSLASGAASVEIGRAHV